VTTIVTICIKVRDGTACFDVAVRAQNIWLTIVERLPRS
jgi:hypothetical protein